MHNTTYLCGLETMVITEKQQIYKNNFVRRTAGVKRTDKRKMEELREEVGARVSRGSWCESLTRKLLRGGLDVWKEWKGYG